MRERLERSGQRSISALVDVTNYVMLELGRPLHVYDLDKLRGPIVVRWGHKGEKVLLLGEQVRVDESVLCITDDSGVIGLGGIMGGESTKADAVTRNVFLESAFFYPDAIAGRARRYGFERRLTPLRARRGFPEQCRRHRARDRAHPRDLRRRAGPTVDTVARLPERKPVTMRVSRAQKVIGARFRRRTWRAFKRLGFPFKAPALSPSLRRPTASTSHRGT